MAPVRSTEEVLQLLRDALPDLRQRYPIARIGIFGSYARGEQTPDSDVDVLVEFNGPIGIEFIDLADDLERRFGRAVDLVSSGSLKKARHRAYILPRVRYA